MLRRILPEACAKERNELSALTFSWCGPPCQVFTLTQAASRSISLICRWPWLLRTASAAALPVRLSLPQALRDPTCPMFPLTLSAGAAFRTTRSADQSHQSGHQRPGQTAPGLLSQTTKTMKPRAFTLIELMITVLIIGMLLAIAIPSYRNGHRRAKENALRTELRVLRSGIFAFYSDCGCYPTSLGHLDDTSAPTQCQIPAGASRSLTASRFRGPYLKTVNNDPVSGAAFTYAAASGSVTSSAAGNDLQGRAYSGY